MNCIASCVAREWPVINAAISAPTPLFTRETCRTQHGQARALSPAHSNLRWFLHSVSISRHLHTQGTASSRLLRNLYSLRSFMRVKTVIKRGSISVQWWFNLRSQFFLYFRILNLFKSSLLTWVRMTWGKGGKSRRPHPPHMMMW